MGGSSESSSSSKTTPTYIKTTQKNPYYITKTDAKGNTTSRFVNGSAGQQLYNYANDNIKRLLYEYEHPSLDTAVNQAKLNQFNKTQQQNLQNNIISPLARNNMVRSSQATNMYNNLSNQSADYTNSLIANSQAETKALLDYLMDAYTRGYTGIASEENTSLNASRGNTTNTNSSAST